MTDTFIIFKVGKGYYSSMRNLSMSLRKREREKITKHNNKFMLNRTRDTLLRKVKTILKHKRATWS